VRSFHPSLSSPLHTFAHLELSSIHCVFQPKRIMLCIWLSQRRPSYERRPCSCKKKKRDDYEDSKPRVHLIELPPSRFFGIKTRLSSVYGSLQSSFVLARSVLSVRPDRLSLFPIRCRNPDTTLKPPPSRHFWSSWYHVRGNLRLRGYSDPGTDSMTPTSGGGRCCTRKAHGRPFLPVP